MDEVFQGERPAERVGLQGEQIANVPTGHSKDEIVTAQIVGGDRSAAMRARDRCRTGASATMPSSGTGMLVIEQDRPNRR